MKWKATFLLAFCGVFLFGAADILWWFRFVTDLDAMPPTIAGGPDRLPQKVVHLLLVVWFAVLNRNATASSIPLERRLEVVLLGLSFSVTVRWATALLLTCYPFRLLVDNFAHVESVSCWMQLLDVLPFITTTSAFAAIVVLSVVYWKRCQWLALLGFLVGIPGLVLFALCG